MCPPRSLHLQPTNHCPAFDSLLHSAARTTDAITAIKTEVPGGASAARARISSFFLPSMLTRGPLLVAFRLLGAARGPNFASMWQRSAAASVGRLGRAAHASSTALVAPRYPPRAPAADRLAPKKSECVFALFSRLLVLVTWVRARLERASSALSNGIGVCVGPV